MLLLLFHISGDAPAPVVETPAERTFIVPASVRVFIVERS
jgi:hypothetical protein